MFRTADDRVFALLDRCPHKGGPLSQGIVAGEGVSCPLHNWTIGFADGQQLFGRGDGKLDDDVAAAFIDQDLGRASGARGPVGGSTVSPVGGSSGRGGSGGRGWGGASGRGRGGFSGLRCLGASGLRRAGSSGSVSPIR